MTDVWHPAPLARTADLDEADLRLLQTWLYRRPPTTRRAYTLAAVEMLESIGKPLREITLGELQAYVDARTAGRKPSTVRATVYALRSLSRFAWHLGAVDRNLATLLRAPPAGTNVNEHVLTEEQVLDLLRAPRSQRHRLLLRTMYVTAGRVSEITRLTVGDVTEHDNGGGLVWLTRKGGDRAAVWIRPATLAELRSLAPSNARPDVPLFPARGRGAAIQPRAVGRMVKRYARKALGAALGARVSPHWLRHSHISHALARGAPVALAQRTAGHRSAATTLAYDHHARGTSSAAFLII